MNSVSIGKTYKTPFAVHCKVSDGLITYMLVSGFQRLLLVCSEVIEDTELLLQFMEDTFGTGNTFRSGGEAVFVSDPKSSEAVTM